MSYESVAVTEPRWDVLGDLWRGVRRAPGITLASVWLVALFGAILLSNFTDLMDPLEADFGAARQAPSAAHWFGTDSTGRDVFARTVAGAQSSFVVALITLTVGMVGGSIIGILSGYLRGWTDRVSGLLIDVLMAFPSLILVMIVVSFRGPSLLTIGTTIGVLTIPTFARVTRAATLSAREREYIQAARLMDTPRWRILLGDIVPNVAPVAITFSFTAMTGAIVGEGSLSFLGFGLVPPTPSWGGIIADGRSLLATAPWVTLAPAIALCVTVLSINLIGERVKEKLR